jgi:glycosyltransferase involved in cell wall biosynthesis/SAM-dependent methyltransferase
MTSMDTPPPPLRAVVVLPVLAKHDAISQAAVDTLRVLEGMGGMEATLLACHNERADIRTRIVPDVAALITASEFLAADLIIYHFGLYNPLFDALLVGNGHGRQVVRFHNVTPAEFVPAEVVPLIERSFAQMANFARADAIWADSRTNALVLNELKYDCPPPQVVPLVVDDLDRHDLADKPRERIEILFLGRFVPSKGVLDLLQALPLLKPEDLPPLRIRLVGSQTYSDPDYVGAVRTAAAAFGTTVEFVGTVDDETRNLLLREAHILAIPSYHEGFCRPVIEALRSGCIPVGYAAHNLPDICAGLGRLVAPGDIAGLAEALRILIEDVDGLLGGGALRLDRGPTGLDAFRRLVERHVQQFEFAAIRDRTERAIRRALPHAHYCEKLSKMIKTRPIIDVRPDEEMRMAERTSLNRLPDLSDWEADGALSRFMQVLNTPVMIHRKSWEYALCMHGLDRLGVVRPDSVGLAVGAGSESPLYYYANVISRMVATDLYDNEGHEGTPLMLSEPERFAPFPYRKDRLEVHSMPGDRLDFADATFDFVFCLSSIEHFGSRQTQRASLDEMARLLKPGGVACIITELILTDHSDREFFRWEEIEDMFLRHPVLQLVGGEPDLSISESLVAFPVDLTGITWPLSPANARYLNRSPHIVLRRREMLWTSLSLFLRRTR